MIKETLLKFFKLDGLVNNLSSYVETRIALVKYELKEELSHTFARIAIGFIFALLLTLFLFFSSLSVAYILAESIGRIGAFGVVAGFYLLLMVLLYLFKNSISSNIENEIKKTITSKHDETGD